MRPRKPAAFPRLQTRTGPRPRPVTPVVPRLAPAALEALKQRVLPLAEAQMLRSADLSMCFEVAYAPQERRAMLAGNAVQRWREGWAAQEPDWFSDTLSGVGAADAAEVIRFVVERMPGRLIEACAAIRRQSEE